MATPPPLPNPLGDSAAPFDWGGGAGDSVKDISFDWGVMSMQLVGQKRPLDVRIVGGSAGMGGGLLGKGGGSEASSVFDQLPKEFGASLGRGEKAGRSMEKAATMFGRKSLGMDAGNARAMGSAVGLAAGVFVGALEKGKAAFIDPLLNAASGGFQTGVSRGMGVEQVSKVFEVVGVTMGTAFLPQIINATAGLLVFNEALKRNKDTLSGAADHAGDVIDKVANPFQPIMQRLDWLDRRVQNNLIGDENRKKVQPGRTIGGQTVDSLAGFLGLTEEKDFLRRQMGYRNTGLQGVTGAAGKRKTKAGESSLGGQDADPRSKYVGMLIARMEKMEGGQPYYSDIADVRAQAQMAALQQDPLDAMIKKELLQSLVDFKASLGRIDDNTKK